MLRILPVIVLLQLMTGCASAIEATPDGVWVKKPFMGMGFPDSVAQDHCAQFGKTAVYKSTINPSPGREYFRPIRAYDCK